MDMDDHILHEGWVTKSPPLERTGYSLFKAVGYLDLFHTSWHLIIKQPKKHIFFPYLNYIECEIYHVNITNNIL